MEIHTSWHTGESAELKVRGRLDSYWADQLQADLDRLVREGTHRLWLDFSEVTYLSSLGVSVLLRFHRQTHALAGSLVVFQPSTAVLEVLQITKLVPMLVGNAPGHPGRLATSLIKRLPRRGKTVEHERATLETFEYPGGKPLRCRTVGDPSLLRHCHFREQDCRPVTLGPQSLALGVGALGRDYAGCQDRFGEFMAAAGVAAYLPSDGRNVPDFLLLGETQSSLAWLCYGIVCEGPLSRMTRFETKKDAGPLLLSELATTQLDLTGAAAVGLVLVAESAGLIGASLRRSPTASAPVADPFAHPEIRQWLTFTGEQSFRSSTVLVVGVALRGDAGPLAPLVRPLGPGAQPAGHFHAAPFSHRTLQIGEIDMKPTVEALFDAHHLQGVLHLLGDYRESAGLGESAFVRGACWAAPLGPVEVERSSA